MTERPIELARPRAVTPKAPTSDDVEIGVSINLPFGAFSADNEYVNPEQDVTIDKLVRMRKTDGQTRALMRLLTLPIRSALKDSGWTPGDDGADEESDYMNQVFNLPPQAGGMSVTKSMFIRKILLAPVEGFSAFEKVFQVPTTGPLAGKVTLKKMAYRPADTVRFMVDDNGGFDGFKQRVFWRTGHVERIIPIDRAWYYAANEEENPFYGVSYFNAAFYHWDKKVKLYYLAHIAAQLAAVPARLGHLPPSPVPGERKAFKEALEKFGFNTAMLVPEGYKVEPFSSKENFNFLELIEHHNLQSSKSILAGFLDKVERQVLIDAAGTGADDMFVMAIEALMLEIEENITHYIAPQLIDWNFASGKYPVWKFGAVADSAKDVLKEVFTALSTASTTNVSAEFLYEAEKKMSERLGLEIDYSKLDQQFEEQQAHELEMKEVERQQELDMAKNPPPPVQPAPNGALPPAPVASARGAAKAAANARQPIAATETGGGAILLSDIAAEVHRLMEEANADGAPASSD